MQVTALFRKLQWLERTLPVRLRLPLRYRAQAWLGALEPEIAVLPALLEGRSGIALDVGANMGIYTYALSGLGIAVHAFEPQVACSEVISAWAGTSTSAITVHNVGVGSSPGELVLYVPIVNGAPVRTRASFQSFGRDQAEMRVPVVVLDALQLPTVAFMKVDVEGFELEVLKGALGLLARDHPALLVEIDRERHTPGSFAAITDLLGQLGYRCHVLQDGSRIADAGIDPWTAPADIYNFIFLVPPASRVIQ